MSIFGTWLQAEIDRRGWDAQTAANRIGVKHNTVHYWLTGQKSPEPLSALKVARALKVSLEEVLMKTDYAEIVDHAKDTTPDEAEQLRAQVLAQLPQFADVIEIMAKEPPDRQAVQIELIRRLLLSQPA